MDLYIYYRVACEHEPLLQTRVSAMQEMLAARHRVAFALKRRPQPRDGRHTWMEVYYAVPSAFEAELAAAVADTELSALIDGERHTEHFLDIRACA
jgi:hypothetical protein